MTSARDPVEVLKHLFEAKVADPRSCGCKYVGRDSSLNKRGPVLHHDEYTIPKYSRLTGALLNELKTPDVDDVFVETGDTSLLIVLFSTPNGGA